ncbi:MAG TPA: hypothetical protein VMU06_03335 [Stellaceae bacterium]|nr:hypothetical protein [Stellaceae bacterium]
MKRAIDELYEKSIAFHAKFGDPELDEYLASLTRALEDADTLHHQLGHLLKHVRATVAHPVRPRHLKDAIERSERVLSRLDAGQHAAASRRAG